VKLMSATDASRNFAAILDEAERGHTIVVTRGGRRVAVIGPAPSATGRAVKELLRRNRGVLDEAFENDVAAGRSNSTDELRLTWPDG
jgi:prevent-host-death family protein